MHVDNKQPTAQLLCACTNVFPRVMYANSVPQYHCIIAVMQRSLSPPVFTPLVVPTNRVYFVYRNLHF